MRSVSSLMNSRKLVLLSHPADVELSVIERAQSPQFRRPASMSIQGEMMDAMYLSKLFDALKQSSSGSSNCQAKPLSEYPPRPKGQESNRYMLVGRQNAMRFMLMPRFAILRKQSIRIRSFLQVRWAAICWRSRRGTPGTTRARCPKRPIVDLSSFAVVVSFERSWLTFIVQATNLISGREIISPLKSKSQPRMTFNSAGPASALSFLSLVSMLLRGVGSSG